MGTAAPRFEYTFAEYLTLESSSNVRHEYFDGQIYAMAGGSPDHAALAAGVIGQLYGQLRGGRCRVFDADLRVRVPATGLTTYPDVTVVCGPRTHDPQDGDTITNPTLVVEVLSRSTEKYDRGTKLEHYRQLETLLEVVLIAQQDPVVEVGRRGADGAWAWASYREGEIAELAAIGARLDVTELYAGVKAPAT